MNVDNVHSEGRLNSKTYREREKRDQKRNMFLAVNSPPVTPPPVERDVQQAATAKTRGRQKVRRDRSNAYREIKRLKLKLQTAESKVSLYRKRLYRAKSTMTSSIDENGARDTPSTKTKRTLKRCVVSNEVRKTLIFHHSLIRQLNDKYQEIRGSKQKQLFAGLIGGKVLKKYRVLQMARREIGCPSLNRSTTNQPLLARFQSHLKLKKGVTTFLERDDNSRVMPGKKDTITRSKVKKQKHLLTDSLRNLHAKFATECPHMKLSYSQFCRYRPFWVVHPSQRDRDTCMCKVHENASFKQARSKQCMIGPANYILVPTV